MQWRRQAVITRIDREELRRIIRQAAPFRYCCIDGFLTKDFAESVCHALPTFDQARKMGRMFDSVNEKQKIQITDSGIFAAPVVELDRLLASPEWLEILSHAFEIPNLLPDEQLVGGGIHQTGRRGRLDVHVDFNYIADRRLHRRLNILVYLNQDWKSEWGGHLEFWDKDVTVCRHSFAPLFNRCIIFETNDISFHGVTAVNCPKDQVRKSFAAYYYTRKAPAHWTGAPHSTVFRSRPDEVVKAWVLMPIERGFQRMRSVAWRLRHGVKRAITGKPGGQG